MAYEIIEEVGTFLLPVIRRVSVQSIAKSLMTVQPMTVPAGGIFYMDYIYNHGIEIEQDMKTPNEEAQRVKDIIVKWIKDNKTEYLQKVIYEKYPQYKEMLDKLLVLAE